MTRWDSLFDDLESQLEHELDAERVEVLAEEERLRMGRLMLRDRIAAVLASDPSAELALTLADGAPVTVRVGGLGRDWLAGDVVDGTRRRAACILPLGAIAAVAPRGAQLPASRGLGAGDGPLPALSARLGLPFVLRDLCRRRQTVAITTAWAQLHGTIDRVGRDHLDLAEHDPGAIRRDAAVRRTLLLPFAGIVCVRY